MKALLSILLRFWHGERRWFLAGIAANAVTIAAGVALLGLSGWFITASALAGSAGVGLAFDFFRPSAGIRFLALGRTAGRYAERVMTHDATLRFLTLLRVDLFRGLAGMNSAALSKLRSSEVLQRLTAEVEALDSLYLRLALPMMVFLLTGAGLMLALMPFGAAIAVLVGALLACGCAVVFAAGAVSRKDARRRAFGLEALRVRTVDLMRAKADLAIAGSLGAQRRSTEKAARAIEDASVRLTQVQLGAEAALSLLRSAFLLAAFLLAAHGYRAGNIGGPQLVLILFVTLAALESLGPLRRGAAEFGRTTLAARRLAPMLVGANKPAPAAYLPVAVRNAAALAFADLEFRYAADRRPVLKQFTARIAPGERIALIGASGSGKSTLLELIAGAVSPTGGRLEMDGRPIVPGAVHLASLGFLMQRTELFCDTIASNLRIAAPCADDAALWAALATVELEDLVRGFPQGLNTRLGESGTGLSGGEARRLALARIVLKAPALWLLDEPTAGLDDALAARVMRRVMSKAGAATVLIAAHHDREAALTDRSIEIESVRGFDVDQSSARPSRALVGAEPSHHARATA